MDIVLFTMDILPEPERASPAVVWANWYRFQPHEKIMHPQVGSVALLWGITGAGVITSGGKTFHMADNSLLILPFGHDITYAPDSQKPFQVGTVHVVPRHSVSHNVVIGVGTLPNDEWNKLPWREGDFVATRATQLPGHLPSSQSLMRLGTHAVECFIARRTSEDTLRSLGHLIFQEISHLWDEGQPTTMPSRLTDMTEFVMNHLADSLGVEAISLVGHCSPSTAERLFRRHTGLPVMTWVRKQRLERAVFLLRTTGLPVKEVGRLVGYPDQLHFSRAFRKHTGLPPSQFSSSGPGP